MRSVALLAIVTAACGARSSLDSPSGLHDASMPDASDPASWTFITPGYPSGLALDPSGNPFFTVSDGRTATMYALDARTSDVRWRSELVNVGVTAIAYDAGALYVTGIGGPGTHVDIAGIGIDLAPLDSYWSSFVAKLDATSGRAIWALSLDADRTPHMQAFSKCVGLAAGFNGAVVVCGYWGDRFGVGEPYLPASGQLAVLRFASDGRLEWAKAFSGDPVGGHVYSWRRAIAFDANGDVWLAGSNDRPLVDEGSSTLILPQAGEHDELQPYVLRIESASRNVGPAMALPFLLNGGETEQDVPSLAVTDHDVFVAGGIAAHESFGMRLDGQTLSVEWKQSGVASNVRAVTDERGGMLLALAQMTPLRVVELVRLDGNGAISRRTTIVTASCSTANGCKSGSGWIADVAEVRFEPEPRAIQLLGVTTGHATFDDGTIAEGPNAAANAGVTFLARRRAF